MKSPTVLIRIGIVALLAAVVLGTAIFPVKENEQVLITQFGQPVGEPIAEPGLHFKIPFVHQTRPFSTEPVMWSRSSELNTEDRVPVVVDLFARWRITDPLALHQTVRDEAGAVARLGDILSGETRNQIARREVAQLVGLSAGGSAKAGDESAAGSPGDRASVLQEILAAGQQRTADLGIEILEVGFESLEVLE